MAMTDGVRRLADWIEANPWAEPGLSVRATIYMLTADGFREAVSKMGGVSMKTTDDAWIYAMTREFSEAVILDVWTGRDKVCERVQVGTKTVAALPAIPAQPAQPERIEPVYEWKCPESILGGEKP